MANNKFEGWVGLDKNAIGNMKWQEFEPKRWEETDIEIQITHSGYTTSHLSSLQS
jgi:alcohol dehydrogenase (NADP+)